MRILVSAICLIFAMFLIVSASALAAVSWNEIKMPDKHMSIESPSDWVSERNYTISGTVYDLYMYGPSTTYYQVTQMSARPVGTVLTAPWLGNITDYSLYNAMMLSITGLKNAFGISNVQVAAPPYNTTINGEKANLAVLYVSSSGITLREQVAIVISDEWREMCALALAVVMPLAAANSQDFNDIQNSITFNAGPGGVGDLTVPLMVGGAIAAVVIVVAVIVLMVGKKRAAASKPLEVEVKPPEMPPVA
jgi:hypothetical protein